jgi:hypothetical protein
MTQPLVLHYLRLNKFMDHASSYTLSSGSRLLFLESRSLVEEYWGELSLSPVVKTKEWELLPRISTHDQASYNLESSFVSSIPIRVYFWPAGDAVGG